jgi:hypothetical protein
VNKAFPFTGGQTAEHGDLHHIGYRSPIALTSGKVDSRQHPACGMATLSEPGALTRAKSHAQMPATSEWQLLSGVKQIA